MCLVDIGQCTMGVGARAGIEDANVVLSLLSRDNNDVFYFNKLFHTE